VDESWVFGGNDDALGSGLNHLPYTAFLEPHTGEQRLGVGIGACVLNLAAAAGVLPEALRAALGEPTLNRFMELGAGAWEELRVALQFLLSRQNKDRAALERALLSARGLELRLPVATRDYTDFYASREHALRVGELFRPEKPLLENYDFVPIGYHGRASSLVPSGTEITRPRGQVRRDDTAEFVPSARLDYELELGYFVGSGNHLGEPIPIRDAARHLFGVSLLNDWSARDVQAWEYQPLGPFLAKSFATSISPWITPMQALHPFRCPAVSHPSGVLDYLSDASDQAKGGVSIRLQVELTTDASRASGLEAFRLSESETAGLFWTPAQMVTHHTSNGCNLSAGDLMGTGTVSGAERANAGCLLELTRGGKQPFHLPNGEVRSFLEDGDEVTLTGYGRCEGQMPIRLGECRGRIVAARATSFR
jgi:fumarylacetoacetase